MNALPHFVDVHADVLDALNNQKPVVALESTIITHGMPFPENMDMAISVEGKSAIALLFPPPLPFWMDA